MVVSNICRWEPKNKHKNPLTHEKVDFRTSLIFDTSTSIIIYQRIRNRVINDIKIMYS